MLYRGIYTCSMSILCLYEKGGVMPVTEKVYPEWVQAQRKRGTTVKKKGDTYYLYKRTSKRVLGKIKSIYLVYFEKGSVISKISREQEQVLEKTGVIL